MNFSLQGTTTAPPPPAPTQNLPELRPPPRTGPPRRGLKALVFLGAVALGTVGVVAGVPGVGKSLKGLFASSKTDIITFTVKPNTFQVTVNARGNLESAKNEDGFCQVEGQTTIITIVPEGTRVTKDQVVCELDSSALKDQLTNQEITTRGADAAYQNARLTREVAEIAVKEYVEGIFKQDWETVLGEIALNDSERKRSEDRLDWSNRMYEKGYVSKAQNIADKLALEKANFQFEQSQTKRNVLHDYTKEKTIKELKSEVEKARSDELAKQATWDLEKTKEKKLRRQIENCQIKAPSDGLVVYANDPNRFGGNSQPQIEEGAAVRERQKIFSLPDISRMRVNTKVHESMIDRLTPNLRARIRVESFADEILPGAVEDVAPLPDPNSMFSSDVKLYTTHVTIEKGLSGLRPGMSAEVEILVTELPNVLSIPVQAILSFKGKDHVSVKTPNGFDWRDVTLGLSNDKLVEIKQGLKTGEAVALNPMALLSEDERNDLFGAGKSGASKKTWGSAPPGTPAAPGAAGEANGKSAAPDGAAAKGGPDGKAKAKGKGQRRGGMGGNMDPAMIEKFKNASPEERQQLIEQFKAANPGGFGGGGGGFGGPPGGGPGGGAQP